MEGFIHQENGGPVLPGKISPIKIFLPLVELVFKHQLIIEAAGKMGWSRYIRPIGKEYFESFDDVVDMSLSNHSYDKQIEIYVNLSDFILYLKGHISHNVVDWDWIEDFFDWPPLHPQTPIIWD